MIDVLLVNPKETGGFFERMPPLGLAYIAATLEQHEYNVRIVDLEIEEHDLDHWLKKYKPKYMGISGTTHTRFASFDLAKRAKRFQKEIVTIYGGVHATFTAVSTLTNCKDIDYVVRGEGEHTLVALLNVLDSKKTPTQVPGISFREKNTIIENPPAERITPLDSLPGPAFQLLDMDKYSIDLEFVRQKGISIITSRGCCAKCSFCSASKMFNHQLTVHSGKRVVDTIDVLFRHYGFKGVKIFDSTLTMQKDHVLDLCREIVERGYIFPWECEIRVGTVDRALLERMKQAGCYYVNFGIESASQGVLDRMRKGFSIGQAVGLLELCKQVGMKTKVFFSFGHIGETLQDVEKTFNFIDRYGDMITTIASGAGIRIYPGTLLYEYARAHGLLPIDFDWSFPFEEKRYDRILQTRCVPVLIQPQLGFRELEDIAMRIYRRRFSGWKGFKRGITKVADKKKWKKLMNLARIKIHRLRKKQGRP
jgi:anaerobic magnesium-protoporphyrin IX monomethyl ester cyclase